MKVDDARRGTMGRSRCGCCYPPRSARTGGRESAAPGTAGDERSSSAPLTTVACSRCVCGGGMSRCARGEQLERGLLVAVVDRARNGAASGNRTPCLASSVSTRASSLSRAWLMIAVCRERRTHPSNDVRSITGSGQGGGGVGWGLARGGGSDGDVRGSRRRLPDRDACARSPATIRPGRVRSSTSAVVRRARLTR